MLRPKEMVRVLIAGPRDRMAETIETLYALQALHVIEGREEDEVFHMGRPLERAEAVSEALVKLRSIASLLELESRRAPPGAGVGPDVQDRIAALEVNIREEEESRKRIDELLRELQGRIEAVHPFAALGVDLAYYGGYESLEVFVGRVPRGLEGIEEVTKEYELLTGDDAVALFVRRADAEGARAFLSRRGFAALPVPQEEGDPRRLLQEVEAERERWQARLQEVRARLTTLRERYAGFVVAAERALEREIQKAEAPLLFVTSDHSFVADGWVPKDRWEQVQRALAEREGLYVDLQETPEEEDPPVLLENPRPVRPFELLTNLFSTPSYKEIDPTVTLFLVFPLFFGLMVGDLGYGAIFAILGAVGYGVPRVRRAIASILDTSEDGVKRFMAIVLLAGVATALFGGLLYGDAFGIPFHPEGEAHGQVAPVSWEGLLHVKIPLYAAIHKLTDIVDLLVLSIVAAFLHLGLGFAIGFFNEVHHDRRHALAKVGWLAVLLGFFLLLLARVRWNRVAAFVLDTVFAPVPLEGLALFGIVIPWVALGLLLGGAGVMAVMEGLAAGNPVALLETASLLANMISYTRLAGIAVAKAAIAEALNNSIFQGLIFPGGVLLAVVGFAFLVLAQLMILFLGGLSAGIQALRLNYVEFFMKFFHGNGVPFKPFGAQPTGST